MGNFKVYTTVSKTLGQTAPAWKCPKTQFWDPLIHWKFEPSHTHSDPNINTYTQIRSKTRYGFVMACINCTLCYRSNCLSHWKARIWLLMAFKKNSRCTHQNMLKPSPVSERSAYLLQNYILLPPTHLCWVREFWPQIYSL